MIRTTDKPLTRQGRRDGTMDFLRALCSSAVRKKIAMLEGELGEVDEELNGYLTELDFGQ